ncbi:MAG: Npun_F0494 family protein [Microcoleaceae cyanobacterium]
MTSSSSDIKPIQYPPATLRRAERAVRCSPFQIKLFTTMQHERVPLNSMVSQSGVEQGYTQTSIPELRAENQLNWLIQVGLLRREVDGQGLTDSFRLTPLGRQLLENWERRQLSQAASLGDRLLNALTRRVRFPI